MKRRPAFHLRVFALLACTACASVAGAVQGESAPLPLHGERVLVLPLQTASGVVEPVEAELLFALRERGPGVTWIGPGELRRALRRSPGYTGDPGALPADPGLAWGELSVAGALAGELRRLAALADVRWVLLPGEARVSSVGTAPGEVQIAASLIDARSGNVLWSGTGSAPSGGSPPGSAWARATADLAARLIANP